MYYRRSIAAAYPETLQAEKVCTIRMSFSKIVICRDTGAAVSCELPDFMRVKSGNHAGYHYKANTATS